MNRRVPPHHPEKPLAWLGTSYRDLMALPAPVRHFFGFALHRAQHDEAACKLRLPGSHDMRGMRKQVIGGVEVLWGSDNVYADLGLPDAEKLKIKAGLAIEIIRAMRRLGLTQEAAAKRMGITQPKVSDLVRGQFSNLSERKLMDCLNRLGYDIEIKVTPTAGDLGRLSLAIA